MASDFTEYFKIPSHIVDKSNFKNSRASLWAVITSSPLEKIYSKMDLFDQMLKLINNLFLAKKTTDNYIS